MQQHNGVTFSELLLVVFIALKLTKIINWNWWWVLSPLWISAGLALIVLAIAGIIYLVGGKK